MNAHRAIVKKPIITEKATLLREGNTYTFQVDPAANKIQIRQAIEALFEVRVDSVRTVSVPSKPRRQGMFSGKRAGWKKAYVTLQSGQSIDVLESV
ncbi:MAG: 50S ribosomal protein L23 [Gemmatimonadetes bacterium]|nr:50S ribosomal protein L23 [Gemmatimonadota bacterium]